MMEEVILENNILKCFSVLHKMQLVLGSNRVAIKDRTVTATTDWHNLYSFIWILAATFSQVYYQKFYFDTYYSKNLIMYFSCLFGLGSEYVSYITCLFAARFTKREENIQIYSLLQKIDRILQLQSDTYFTNFQATVQNRTMMLITVFFPLGLIINAMEVMDEPVYSILLAPALLTLYVDFMLFGGFIGFIGIRLTIFNKMMNNYIREYEHEQPEKKLPKSIAQIAFSLIYPNFDVVESTLESNKWLECIQEILKCYQIITDVYNFQILTLAVTVMLWSFISIGTVIVGIRTDLYSTMATMTTGAWVVFYFVLLTVLAIFSDWFLYEIKKTKLLCVRVMSSNIDDSHRNAAGVIFKTIHYTKPKFVVYDVFEFDSKLTLTLIGLVATNVLVVIQFIVSRN